MNIILSVFTAKAYKEYILPHVNNTNYTLILEREIFGMQKDTVLHFDVIENNWRLLSGTGYDYRVRSKADNSEQLRISSGMKFEVICSDSTVVRVNVSESKSNFFHTQKFRIKGNSITIGSAASNDIICKASFISHSHAKIAYIKDGWHIEDLSQNGVFVNAVRVKVNTPLQYGDFINIVGLKLVFLGDIVAVSSSEDAQIEVNPKKLTPAIFSFAPSDEGEENDAPVKEYFNRAPRIIRELHTEPIEIEAPPSPKPEGERSFLMTIGPSLTMALPMLLGCILMIYSSRSSGGSPNAFMFTGLITALGSAAVGAFWGIINFKKNANKGEEEERHRFEAYSNYIMNKTEEIKEKNHSNAEIMNEIYPSAVDCLNITSKSHLLWNRNFTHEDFLNHRLGIGQVDFQADINIPKEKFTLIDDSLSDKPKLIKETYRTLNNVPICIDLYKNRLIGIVSGKNKTGAYEVMKNLSIQMAVSNCYTDVKIGYIFKSSAKRNSLTFSKWLPHCWSEDKKTRFCAYDEESASDVCYELTKIFRLRDENAKENSAKKLVTKPHYVLFVEDISILEGEPLAKYIFDSKEEYGLTTVLFAENYEDLPNSCECIIYNDGVYTGVYTPNTLSTLGDHITFDHIEDKDIESFARSLSKIEVAEVETGGEIPNSLTFLDMYHVDRVEKLNVIERWKKNRTYENMKSLIGQKAGGVDCYLDIHEKYHGPHGLVAGTTGSGKSETLQTYILSLALNYSPDDVGFLLVDFKGGGMANLFTDLPHTLGQISNLSGAQVRRAMVSIKSENLRRQRMLSEHGVNNINSYTRLLKNNEATTPLPHLFIIIDEFAELKREEPEFMAELISVAQVGRSLGVHLILATQKPGGTVDDNIRSNSKFKLCLRVQDKQDSTEMLGRPEAAYLSQAGRCYLQVGNDEIFELFQSGWSGATYDETSGSSNNNLVKLISTTGKTTLLGNKTALRFKEAIKERWLSSFAACIEASCSECGMSLSDNYDTDKENQLIDKIFELLEQMELDFPKSRYNEKTTKDFIRMLDKYGSDNISLIINEAHKSNIILPEPKEKTQLDAVIKHIGDIANQYGYKRGMALWLPMLPEYMYLDSFEDFRNFKFNGKEWQPKQTWTLSAPVGLCDDPENQAQLPLVVNFAENGHLAVCGNVTSGKSTFVQSLLYSLINIYSPEQLNIYAIDFSNHMLECFADAPHTGAVMFENDNEKIDKFFYMLNETLISRKKAIGGANYGQFVNANGYVFPSMIVAIDNYSNFREKTDDKYERILWELSRDGASVGIFLVFTAGGFGSIEIQNKIAENIRNVIALDLGEKMKFSEILRINHLEVMPTTNVKGRGLVPYAGTVLEFHTALSLEAADDYSRAEKIREQCRTMAEVYTGPKAAAVPEIPEKPTWTDISANAQFNENLADVTKLPFAYVKETASIYSVDLRETFCYLLQGKTRTGRTELLKVMAASAKAKDADVVLIDSEDGQLRRFAEKIDITYVSTAKGIYDYASKLLPVFKERNVLKRSMIENGSEEDEIFERLSQEKPIFIFVSNFAGFLKTVYTAHDECGMMNGFFENILEKGRLHNIFFVFDCNMEEATSMLGKKIYNVVTGYKTGVQLGGLTGQKVFDVSTISYTEQSKTYRPGTGMAFGVGTSDKIIIPLSRGV